MKKLTLKPGFEFIFSLSIMAILCLPPIVLAQNKKDVQITIANGDTTINGKNIKDLSPKERKNALNDIVNINNIPPDMNAKKDGSGRREIIIQQQKDGNGDLMFEKRGPDSDQPMMADGDHRNMRFRFKKQMDKDSTFAFNYRMNGEPPHRMMMDDREMRFDRPEGRGMMGFNRRNTQNFNYTNTDNQGVSTHIIYHVSEPSGAIAHVPGEPEPSQYEMLDIKDLSLVPQFSQGKTILMFSLPSKAAADVKLKDSSGNVLWSEKTTNGSFNKSFTLGLNGEYYLHVRQGKKMIVKKIFKEQL